MATIEIKRNYTMLDAELCMFASNLCVRLTRDLSDLSTFGIQASSITALKALGDDFEAFPSDDTYYGEMLLATQTKNQLADQVRESIRNMALRVQLKWGANSPQYKTLGDMSVSKFSDEVLSGIADKILGRMNVYLADLASTGLTQQDIDDYEELIESYEEALNSLSSAIELRDIKAKERILMGNELYSYVVNYCEIGKRVYEKSDPAKYNDYIIYTSTSPGSLTAPQNFMFDPVNYDFSWSAVENATSYILQQSTDGTNWTQYWSGHETTCGYEESPTTMMYFRVLGHNAGGNSAPSTVIQYDFAPILVAPTNFNYDYNTYYFSWNAVPNAEYYEFQYRAQTNPTWNSLNAGSATSFYHADPPGDYVARVRAVSGTTMGPWSIEEEYSVGAP